MLDIANASLVEDDEGDLAEKDRARGKGAIGVAVTGLEADLERSRRQGMRLRDRVRREGSRSGRHG